MEADRLSKCKSLKRNGGAYGTIFATFSYHHQQKCSVSCNSCEASLNGDTIDRTSTNWLLAWRLKSRKAASPNPPLPSLASEIRRQITTATIATKKASANQSGRALSLPGGKSCDLKQFVAAIGTNYLPQVQSRLRNFTSPLCLRSCLEQLNCQKC
jgi:hypothetical protein